MKNKEELVLSLNTITDIIDNKDSYEMDYFNLYFQDLLTYISKIEIEYNIKNIFTISKLYMEGHTFSEISNMLNMSRNAIDRNFKIMTKHVKIKFKDYDNLY